MPALRRVWVAAVLLGGGAFIGLRLVADLTPDPLDPAALPATLDLTWAVAAQFGAPDRPAEVRDATRWGDEIIAVGTQYDGPMQRARPLPPHRGLVWVSSDGQRWQDITEPGRFNGLTLRHVYVAADGSLVAVGALGAGDSGSSHRFWQSSDGRHWVATDFALPPAVVEIHRGPRGYLLFGRSGEHDEFWLADDGLTWKLVRDNSREGLVGELLWDVAAGDNGFVAIGATSFGDSVDSFALASADGHTWRIAPSPPWEVTAVAPIGGGWEAIQRTSGIVRGRDSSAAVWRTTDGLVWRQVGIASLPSHRLDAQTTCHEQVDEFHSAGDWRLLSTTLSAPCQEGTILAYGPSQISIDGVRWEPLPFPEFFFDASAQERRAGSVIHAAIVWDDGLILAGQSNSRATFWLGVPD